MILANKHIYLYVFEKPMYDTNVITEDKNMNMKELLVDT